MNKDKESKKIFFIIVIFGILLPLSNLWLAIIFTSGIVDINLQKYSLPLIIVFSIYSIWLLVYMGLQIKKNFPGIENIPEEKREIRKLFYRIMPLVFPSILGLFLAILGFNIIYPIIGTSLTIILVSLFIFGNKKYIKVFPRPENRLKGITFLGWLYIITGILFLIIVLILPYRVEADQISLFLFRMGIIGYIFLDVGIGFGLLYLFNAVRILVIIFNSFHIFGGILGLITFLISNEPFQMGTIFYRILIILIPALIVYYLTRSKVKENFTPSNQIE